MFNLLPVPIFVKFDRFGVVAVDVFVKLHNVYLYLQLIYHRISWEKFGIDDYQIIMAFTLANSK